GRHPTVELSQGCYHMTYCCPVQFCYLCQMRKTCDCRRWNENYLINDAQRGVFNEFDAQVRLTLHAEQVHHRIDTLRLSHECRNHH
ncbi:hypothetical protein SCLCIDRAFT_127942, partial [Scleroderma citrinum Foug A]